MAKKSSRKKGAKRKSAAKRPHKKHAKKRAAGKRKGKGVIPIGILKKRLAKLQRIVDSRT